MGDRPVTGESSVHQIDVLLVGSLSRDIRTALSDQDIDTMQRSYNSVDIRC